ncbi:hypothetical protein FALBO_6973 [Fusarium albosuccineum]|uniref:Uncharacterized protein n=1 Tax=Fusarium albosuccineum TaxID=1237068 RepID=A0A8H4LC44_9HYPO|nr:hypothetical protein FALBO_6973 [Fusarium albosuccineum]KAF4990118.1 hypothetical protein FDECE_14483 [Fusarium decemcellulare]
MMLSQQFWRGAIHEPNFDFDNGRGSMAIRNNPRRTGRASLIPAPHAPRLWICSGLSNSSQAPVKLTHNHLLTDERSLIKNKLIFDPDRRHASFGTATHRLGESEASERLAARSSMKMGRLHPGA